MSVNSGGSPAGSEGSTQGQGQGDTGGGDSQPNVHELLEQHRQALEQTQGLFQNSDNELRQLKDRNAKTESVIDGIRKALNGGDDKENNGPDPVDTEIKHYEELIDQYLGAAMEAERKGRPIPLTVKNAIESFQGHIKQLKVNKTQAAEIAELKKLVSQAVDPQTQIDNGAFASIDSMIVSSLNTLYGTDDPEKGDGSVEQTKSEQFRAVARMIGSEIKSLRANDPDMWDRIRRSPQDQRKLVNHFVKRVIPPAAHKLMEEKQIQDTPITTGDLWAAFREAGEIKDGAEKKRVRDAIRQQLVQRMFQGKAEGGTRGGLNQMYRGAV